MPDFKLDDQEIDLVDELRVLGVVVRSDLKWTSNTENIVLKGFKRVWIIRWLRW